MSVELIEKTMKQFVDDNEMVGGELFVHQGDMEVYHGQWGYANLETKAPYREGTLMCMCSMTKVLTAAGFLKLVEQGRVGLDDEVRKFIPEFTNLKVVADKRFEGMENVIKYLLKREPAPLTDAKLTASKREITMRDLLTHSSGLEMGVYGMLTRETMKCDDETLATRATKMCKMALDFQPGTNTGYSPILSFDLIARLIEVITNEDFAEYMKREIFEPLKMKEMMFQLTKEQEPRLMSRYKVVDGEFINVNGTKEDLEWLISSGPLYHSGAGGAYGRISDYDRFTRMLANEGTLDGVQILRPETVRMMYQERAYNHLKPEPGMEWGLGVKVRQDPVQADSYAAKGTYGWSGAFGTHMLICPDKKLAVTFGTNRTDLGGAGSYISKMIEKLVFENWG